MGFSRLFPTYFPPKANGGCRKIGIGERAFEPKAENRSGHSFSTPLDTLASFRISGSVTALFAWSMYANLSFASIEKNIILGYRLGCPETRIKANSLKYASRS